MENFWLKVYSSYSLFYLDDVIKFMLYIIFPDMISVQLRIKQKLIYSLLNVYVTLIQIIRHIYEFFIL